MKRVLALLVLFALPAQASTLVIRSKGAGNFFQAAQEFQMVQEILDERGATWHDVPATGITTANAKAGNLVFGNTTYAHDAVVFVGADINTAGTQSSCNWCAMTLVANWPSVPTLIINANSHSSGQWTQTVGCSTGVTGWSAARDAGYNLYSAYMVGTPYAWHTWGQLDPVSVIANSAGTFRVVVSASGNQSSRRLSGASTNFNINCTDCDSLVSFAKQDTLALLWVRYRTGAPSTPIIFVQAGTQNPGLIKMAMAMLDSVTGGRVFDNASLRTKKRGFVVGGGFSRNSFDSLLTSPKNRGMDPSDSTNVSAGIDSLASLGIPFTFMVDPDSASTYPSDLTRMKRASKAHFGLEMYGGSYVQAGAGSGNASQTHALDPFGHYRARVPITRTWTTFATACSATDTSTTCLLQSGMNWLKTNVPDAIDRVIYPAFNDYSPNGRTADGASGESRAYWGVVADTLNSILCATGFHAVLVNPLLSQANVGRGWATTGAASGPVTAGTDPWGFETKTRSEIAYTFPKSGTAAGTVNYLAFRSEFDTKPASWKSGHVIDAEWSRGEMKGDSWYPDWPTLTTSPVLTQANYQHDFQTRTPIIYCAMGHLGGASDGVAHRQGWWAVKWTEMQMRAVNALMIPGRYLDQWDYCENIQP